MFFSLFKCNTYNLVDVKNNGFDWVYLNKYDITDFFGYILTLFLYFTSVIECANLVRELSVANMRI